MKRATRAHTILTIFLAICCGTINAWAASPTLTETVRIEASDAAPNDLFGRSVSVDGPTIAVGAPGDEDLGADSGSVYIFSNESGSWSEEQKLTATDGSANDQFGYSTAIDGDTLVVSAPRADGRDTGEGALYVYKKVLGAWQEQQKLWASDGNNNEMFGWSVAVDGNTVVATTFIDNEQSLGAAYVFVEDAGIWTEQQKIIASDATPSDRFGRSVALKGNIIVVGALTDDDKGFHSGSAYVFERNSDTWTEGQKIAASDGAAEDRFGISVAISESTIGIGALFDDPRGFRSGSAYIYSNQSGNWTEEQKLIASDGVALDRFGQTIALQHGKILVGAMRDDTVKQGAAYLFNDESTGWTESLKFAASDGGFNNPSSNGDRFAWSIDLSEDTAVVGAAAAEFVAGVAYVFQLTTAVKIDIKPGDGQNCFNANGHGVIPVAVLGSESLDVSSIDQTTLSFGGATVRVRGNKGPFCGVEDVDADGFYDLVCQFEDNPEYWEPGQDDATLTGALLDGTSIEGTDTICIVP